MTAPPASPEAVAAGCSCPAQHAGYLMEPADNIYPAPGAWVRRGCPVHGCTCQRSNHAAGSEPLADPACPVHPARDDGGCDA